MRKLLIVVAVCLVAALTLFMVFNFIDANDQIESARSEGRYLDDVNAGLALRTCDTEDRCNAIVRKHYPKVAEDISGR